jgi:thiamine-phosphate pyrophosphorylase
MLREKDLDEDEYKILAEKVFKICNDNNITFIINKYYRVADEIRSEYIHLSFDDYVRYMGKNSDFKIVGVSVHSVDEALYAEMSGASYVVAGHIYATECKKNIEPRGLEFLSQICSKVSIPVYAIGGITKNKYDEIKKAGAKGACLMSECMK